MVKRRDGAILTLMLFFTAAVLGIVLGELKVRHSYLTRGIAEEMPQPIAASGTELGINVYFDGLAEADLEDELEKIARAGYKSVKHSFFYSSRYDWPMAERLVEAINESGLYLIPLLDGDPSVQFAPPHDLNNFAAWSGEFAARFGDSIDYYMIWDEPNLTAHWGNQPVNPEEYGALLSAASMAIKSTDPRAWVIAAPLAPTVETGPMNISAHLYLQRLYENGVSRNFDIVAGKPYGFDYPPSDRTVDPGVLNFSHILLLRETMDRNGDGAKAIWAGNWGWNALPDDWDGDPSIWGQVDATRRLSWTIFGFERAQKEWPWMGVMFLENWKPGLDNNDPRWGFSVADQDIPRKMTASGLNNGVAAPGFHLAQESDPAQEYTGGWRFSPDYGADIRESGDRAQLRFWGTDVGIRVRRANYRARIYVTVDGQPANALPRDDRGAFLILTSPSRVEDYLSIELVAQDLLPGIHTLSLEADRGWDQWAINGYSVGYRPRDGFRTGFIAMSILFILTLSGALLSLRAHGWHTLARYLRDPLLRLDRRLQFVLTVASGALLWLSGWLTWGQEALGPYRRLGEGGPIAFTAAAATIFYVSPVFILYVLALVLLLALIYTRPSRGLMLVAFAIPFYVKPKPMLGYQFSPVEIFVLLTLGATLLHRLTLRTLNNSPLPIMEKLGKKWLKEDWAVLLLVAVATVSLPFTERLDVATNEWRVLIVEPVIFYFLLRIAPLDQSELWRVVDAFVLGALVIALIGLGQLITGQNLIESEAGLMRVRSIFGSPNNLALYLGRALPVLLSVSLLGQGRRRTFYLAALPLVSLAFILTFSKGGIFLGLPAALITILILWQRKKGARIWPWLTTFALISLVLLVIISQIPQLAARLNPQGDTGIFRINLWRSSLEMIREHPLFGVGLDNFLYAYRGRYIMDAAWQEPNLNHPHNIFLDFATRIGIIGLLAGTWLLALFLRRGVEAVRDVRGEWIPLAVSMVAFLSYSIAHGLVDHSFFLVDLSYSFYLMLGIGLLITNKKRN